MGGGEAGATSPVLAARVGRPLLWAASTVYVVCLLVYRLVFSLSSLPQKKPQVRTLPVFFWSSARHMSRCSINISWMDGWMDGGKSF